MADLKYKPSVQKPNVENSKYFTSGSHKIDNTFFFPNEKVVNIQYSKVERMNV